MNRQEAIAVGSPRYHGRPCRTCGGTERYTAHCECCCCARTRSATDYRKHISKRRAVKAAYNAEHREESRVRTAAWNLKNPGATRERAAQWHRKNPDKSCAKTAKRRAALANRTPAWANLDAVTALYVAARRLTETTGVPHHVDHIIPLHGATVSGLHVETNLQILSARDNLQKGNRLV